MSTHNIGFYGEKSKIITELSSNTQLISSAVWGTGFALTNINLPENLGKNENITVNDV